jgi:ATP-dependent Clp protease ATP-binding subunit ClpX
MQARTPTPQQIAEFLGERVIQQREAVTEISVALAKRLAMLPVGNVLMIGGSGTGKTTLMQAVEAYLEKNCAESLRPVVVRIHANVLGEEAQKGRPGEALLARLLERAREVLGATGPVDDLLEHARRGIVFVDEIDKIRSHVGDRTNISGILAQEALLTVMENEAVPFTLPGWAGGELRTVDVSGLLFICAGAFEGLYDAVLERITIGKDKDSLKPVTVVEDGEFTQRLEFWLRDWLRQEDIFDYGIGPQFLARFDAMVLLEDLETDSLAKIFTFASDSGYRKAQAYFESRQTRLTLTEDAVMRIAREASKSPRLGARALGEVFRRVIRSYEFEPERFANENREIIIDAPDVEARLKR